MNVSTRTRVNCAVTLLAGAAALAIVSLLAGCAEARRTNRDAWCTRFTGDQSLECSYQTLQQCLATIRGVGGDCLVNPRYNTDPDYPPSRRR